MAAQILAGQPVADSVLATVTEQVERLSASGRRVGLGTILVGDDPASAGYIRIKRSRAQELGIDSHHLHLPQGATQQEVEQAVRRFNQDERVDAMLIQHPLPQGLDYEALLEVMDPDKDADGLHPYNLGKLVLGRPGPLPCTPAGIEAMLAHYKIDIAGAHVVILGRGLTLGRPLSILLSQKRPGANAAVSVIHSAVQGWERYTRQADVVVAAVGVPGILKADHIRPGAVVVGGGVRYEGRRVLSDVEEGVAEVAGWVTPRVGGVGPMTVAMLFKNALDAALRKEDV